MFERSPELSTPESPSEVGSPALSINSDLLRQAKGYQINLSKALEQRLVETLLEEKRRRWREENQDAIEAYNRRIETGGVFSDGFWMCHGDHVHSRIGRCSSPLPGQESCLIERPASRNYSCA